MLIIVQVDLYDYNTSSNSDPHEVYGFKYWSNPGAFSNGALGVVNAFVLASFSMQGTEIVGITAGECENPLKVNTRLHHKIKHKVCSLPHCCAM